jgi:hypothetical protein
VLIKTPFTTMHVSGRDRSNQIASNGEDDSEQASRVGLTEDSEPRLGLRVLEIGEEENRAIEEDLLGLGARDLVSLPVFLGIAVIPLEAGAAGEVVGEICHGLGCILQ